MNGKWDFPIARKEETNCCVSTPTEGDLNPEIKANTKYADIQINFLLFRSLAPLDKKERQKGKAKEPKYKLREKTICNSIAKEYNLAI